MWYTRWRFQGQLNLSGNVCVGCTVFKKKKKGHNTALCDHTGKHSVFKWTPAQQARLSVRSHMPWREAETRWHTLTLNQLNKTRLCAERRHRVPREAKRSQLQTSWQIQLQQTQHQALTCVNIRKICVLAAQKKKKKNDSHAFVKTQNNFQMSSTNAWGCFQTLLTFKS